MVAVAVRVVQLGGQVSIAGEFVDTVVTEFTPAHTQLAEGHPCLVAHEGFRTEFPSQRYRGEVTPAVVFVKFGGTVDTDIGLQQVAVENVIVYTADETDSCPFAVKAIGLVAGETA